MADAPFPSRQTSAKRRKANVSPSVPEPTFYRSQRLRPPRLEPDGYIHQNLCRHMAGAGRIEELVWLLFKPQWANRQVNVNDILTLGRDFATGLKAVEDEMGDENNEESLKRAEELLLISEAVTLSSGYVGRNKVKLLFQLHGRLLVYRERFHRIQEYLNWMEEEAPGPKVLCSNEFLVQAGGPNTKIIPTGVPVNCMVLLNHEEQAACGSQDGRIIILNVLQSKTENVWHAHSTAVVTISVVKDGTRIVSGSTDGSAKVWHVNTGLCLTTFDGHTGTVNFAVAMKGEERVVSGSDDGTAQIWNINTGRRLTSIFLSDQTSVECVAVFEDGEHVVTGGRAHNIKLWNSTTGVQVGPALLGHRSWVKFIIVTPNGQRLVSASWDKSVRIWDIATHRQIGISLEGHTDRVQCVAVSPDGCRIASGAWDKTIRLWDSKSGKETCDPLKGHADAVTGVSFLGDSNSIISCSWDGTVRVWDTRRKKTGEVISRHEDRVTSVSFVPGGKFVVSGSFDRTLRIWDAQTGRQVDNPLRGHSHWVNGVTVTPDGLWALSVSHDRTVRGWDLNSHNLLFTLSGYGAWIRCVAITPQGDRLITGSYDGTVCVLDLTMMGQCQTVFEGHRNWVQRVFVTDDGLRIVSVDRLDNIFVWELATEDVVKRVRIADARRLSRRLILSLVEETTLDDDAGLSVLLCSREIVYGEGPDRQVLATMECNVQELALSPDGETICMGLEDGKVGFMKLKT